MIDDDQPTTPPPSPPPPPIAPAPSPLGLGRRLLGSIRALSSAIALPSPPPASSSPRLGLSLLLHLKPDLQLHDPPPPPPSSASASHQGQEQAEDPLLHDEPHPQAAPTHASKAKRALHHLLLPQPTPCSSLAPAAAAVGHNQEEPRGPLDDGQEEEGALHLHTQGAAKGDQPYPCAGGGKPGPTEGLNVLEQDKGDRLDLPVPKQAGTLLSIEDDVAAGDDHRDELQQQQRTSVVDHQLKVDAIDDEQLEVDATTHPRPRDDEIAAQEQDELATHGLGWTRNDDAVEGQEVVEQGVVAGMGQGTEDATAVAVDDDQEKPLEQCTSTSCEELGTSLQNDGAKDDQEEVEQGVIDQGDAAMDDDNAVKDHEVVEQGVIDQGDAAIDDDNAVKDHEVVEQGVVVVMGQGTDATAVAVDDDQEKPLEQCSSTSCEELGTAENGDAEDGHEVVEQGVIDRGGAAMDDDDAVKGHEVVWQSVIDAIAVDDDQEKAVEQSSTSCEELGTTMENDDDAVQVQEAVKQQDGTHPRNDIAAEGQETLDGHDLGSTENADAVQVQEVVKQQDGTHPRNDIAAEGQETLEGHDLGSTENADAVQVQEAVERGVIGTDGESADATAVDDHDKVAEQCTTYDDLGTTMENDGAKDDQEEVEQGVIDQGDAAIDDDNAVKDHEVLLLGVVEGTRATTDDIASVEDQGNNVEQCTSYDDLGTTMKNDDAVDDQQVVEQGVVDLTMDDDASVEEQEVIKEGVVDLTMVDDSVEDHEVLQQGIIDGTDGIAVEKQEKVLERCSRATKDEYTVKEMEMVVEQGVIDPKYMDLATKDQDKLSIIDDQVTVPMDNIVVKEAVVQYDSDAIVTIKDESPVEEHDTVWNQGVIDKNGRTKDDIDVEGHGYVKEQVIVDKWGTSSDATALEDQKNEAELCIGDEQIAGKDMDGVHAEGNMLEQRTGDKQGAIQSDFTVDKHKDVVERVRHEWGAPEDDLAMDTTAYQGTRDWGIVNKEKVKLPEDDRAMDTAAYQGTRDWGIVNKEKYKMPARRYPQKPRKLNCPSYMSKGTCTYGPSCHFNHPPQLKARSDDSWRPSERRNHGAAEILELNRLGLPIREGARNCDYYMRTGACKYGKNCHFNHPDHVIDAQFNPPTGWEDNALQMEKSSDHTLIETSHMKKSSDDATLDDRSHLKKSPDGATVDDTSYSKKSSDHDTSSSSGVLPPNILRMLLPPQKVLPSTEGKAKKKSDWSSASDDSDGCCSDGPLCKQGEHVDYPERPGRPEYHHPKQSKDKEEVNYPERPGRPDCPFYMRFGDCKFASACNYHHPKDKYSAGRPEEPECPFLMKRGFCKFGAQCKFYHPEGSNPATQSPTDAERSVTTDERHPSTRITPEDHVPQQPHYPERRSITTDEHHPSTRITPEDHAPQQPQYPERPGQPECRYYLQFGKCKYLSACIFHHPKDRLAAGWNPSDPAHSDMPDCPFYMKAGKCQFGSACEFRHSKDIYSTTEEAFGQRTGSGAYDNGVEQQEESVMYPERPGEPECAHYMRQGYCKFQMNCKYHHPGDWLSKKHTPRLTTELIRTDHLSNAVTRWLPHECYQRQALS